MSQNVGLELNLDGTRRTNEMCNLTLAIPKKLDENALEDGDYIEHKFQLAAGILANVPHSIILEIERRSHRSPEPVVCLYVKLNPKSTEKAGITKECIKLSFLDLNDPATVLLRPCKASAEYCDSGARRGYTTFKFSPSPWPEKGCLVSLSIPFYYRKLPSFTVEMAAEPRDLKLSEKRDSKDFFMSETFSDVVVECQGQTFPAHRVILAGSSPVFKAMLSLPMKEAERSRIVIKDVDAQVLKGLLRFIYTGDIEPAFLQDHGEALYCAADKYNIQDLLLASEVHLLGSVKAENALVMYDLAQRRPESLLARKSREIISRNKDSIAADVDSFKNFTIKYPALMFEIFKR